MGAMSSDILPVAVKSMAAAVVLFILARIMGKKQISQLSFFDYVVGISIGSVAAAVSVDNRIHVFEGIVCMIIWALFPIAFSFTSQHSIKARRLLDGTPTILIQNGKIVESGLKKVKFTVNDLLEELRIKDVFDPEDVEFAILETGGKLSILKKAGRQALPAGDMNIPVQQKCICANVIIDGKLMRRNMEQFHVDESRLMAELKKQNINSAEEVLLGCLGMDGKLHIDRKNSDPEELKIFL